LTHEYVETTLYNMQCSIRGRGGLCNVGGHWCIQRMSIGHGILLWKSKKYLKKSLYLISCIE